MKEIKAVNGSVIQVDDDDYEELSRYKWYLDGNGYAVRGECVSMHRMIMKAPKGLVVDHINHRPADNRKENLRLCTTAQNSMNMSKRRKIYSSRYKGVRRLQAGRTGKPWLANIRLSGRTIFLGSFDKEEHAAMAYDMWARMLFGEFANTNFTPVCCSLEPLLVAS